MAEVDALKSVQAGTAVWWDALLPAVLKFDFVQPPSCRFVQASGIVALWSGIRRLRFRALQTSSRRPGIMLRFLQRARITRQTESNERQ
jgi:hypothetical protein